VKVGQVMKRDVVRASPDEDVRSIAKKMIEHDVPIVPVVEGRKYRGTVTFRRLLKELERISNRSGFVFMPTLFDVLEFPLMVPEVRKKEWSEVLREFAALKAEEVMEHRYPTLREDDDLEYAIEVFTEKGISSVPVVDGDGNLVGVLSRRGLLEALLRSASNGRAD